MRVLLLLCRVHILRVLTVQLFPYLGTAISGEKCRICSGIWSRTYAPQFDHGKALVEGVTSQYDR